MRLGIIGSGNVGSALGLALEHYGYNVIFYDVNIEQLKKFNPRLGTTNFDDILGTEVTFVTVPTEAMKDGSGNPDMSIYESVINQLKEAEYRGLVVQVSTCPPLTARRMSEKLGDVRKYAVCPSHYSMGKMDFDALHPVRTMIGTSDGASNPVMAEIFGKFDGPMYFDTYETVELIKYVENALVSTTVSFWNEVFMISKLMEDKGFKVDSDHIAKIVDVSPFWRSIYRFHGKAFSGLCLPKDLDAYVTWCMEELKYYPDVAAATRTVNNVMNNKYGVQERHAVYR